jgi:nucleotide-binding universal stress UspA family protein
MFERILVCLDGSELAEQILPFAKQQALRFSSEVHLLHVVEKTDQEHERIGSEEFQAPLYLENTAASLRKNGIDVNCVTMEGTAGEVILDYADQHHMGLIAMATHGRSGLGRAVRGSVANFVLRESGLPILSLKPKETGTQARVHAQPIKKILACLDGSELAEQIMPYATEEALRFQSKLILFQAVPEPVAYSPGIPGAAPVPLQTDTMLEEAKKALNASRDYLGELATPLRERGIQVEAVTILGRAEEAILDYADSNSVKLITIATHGRGGLRRAVFGSVADYVLREFGLPILVIRPREAEDKD